MKILDIAFKDLTRSFRSAFAIGMAVVMPLMLTGLLYFAFGGASNGTSNLPQIKVGVVNLDVLPANVPLDAPLGDSVRSMFFDDSVKSWIVASDYADEASARAALDRQEIGVAVIIPKAFTEHFFSGAKDVKVLVVSDPTLSIGPAVVENMITSMLDGVSGTGIAIDTFTNRQVANGIQPDPSQIPAWIKGYSDWYINFQRNLFHHPDRAAFVMVTPTADESTTTDPIQKMMGATMAGQMIFFAFFTAAYSMMSILREQEEGTLARLFTTPTGRSSILAGKFAAVFLTVVIQGLVLMLAGHYAFGIKWGKPLVAVMALTGQVVTATGLGVLLIAFVKSSRQSGPVLGGGLTALGMLSGLFTTTLSNPPAVLTMIAKFMPQGLALEGWRLVMDGSSAGDLLTPFAVMLAMGAAMFAVGAVMFRRRFA